MINQLTGATEKARNRSDTTAKRSFMVNSSNSSDRDLQTRAQRSIASRATAKVVCTWLQEMGVNVT